MLLLLPSHFHQRAEFHHRLGQFVSSGLSVTEGLEEVRRAPPSSELRRMSETLLAELANGRPLGDAFRKLEDDFGPLDVALIEAGERAGRLGPSFHHLAVHYRERAALASTFVAQISYPAFVLLLGFAVFGMLLPWAQSQGSASLVGLALRTFFRLAMLLSLAGLIAYALQGSRGQHWRAVVERILSPVPLLGSGRRALALSRLAFALEALVAAGAGFVEAWPIAAQASHSEQLRGVVDRWKPLLELGQSPADLLRAERPFAGFFANMYATGETTGTLQESLRRIAVHYQDEGVAKLRSFTSWMPRLIYLGIAIYLAFQIIGFYRGYFKTIDSFFQTRSARKSEIRYPISESEGRIPN